MRLGEVWCGFRFNCSYYGWTGKIVHIDPDCFWIELDHSCKRVPQWDIRFFNRLVAKKLRKKP